MSVHMSTDVHAYVDIHRFLPGPEKDQSAPALERSLYVDIGADMCVNICTGMCTGMCNLVLSCPNVCIDMIA